MQIDRRITNGLAWAGAILVVGIPAADFTLRQISNPSPQVAVVQQENADPADSPVTETVAPEADPIVTANTPTRPSSGNAVDDYIQSGRELPSYISGGGNSTATPPAPRPTQTATAAPTQTATPPAAPATSPTPVPQAPAPAASTSPTTAAVPPATTPTTPRTTLVTLPTPVSQRPPSVARAPVAPPPGPGLGAPQQPGLGVPQAPGLGVPQPPANVAQQPLIIENRDQIITAEDLEDWESGPLSEFLNGRRGGSSAPEAGYYDQNGFFVEQEQAPTRVQRLPSPYGDSYFFPFSQ